MFSKIDAVDAGNDEGLESGVQRPNRTTGRTGCSAFVYVRKDARAIGQPWTIRSSCFEHNHPLSEDKRVYDNNKKLEAEDQELAISLMRAGTTPSETLKVRLKVDMEKLIVSRAVIIIKVIVLPIIFIMSLYAPFLCLLITLTRW